MELAAVLVSIAMQPGVARAQSSQVPVAARGDTAVLTLEEVHRLALQRNLEFLADRQETAVALGELRQARAYRFNPDLSVIGPRGSGTSTELTLMQEIEWAGQRGLRIGAARSGVTGASATVRDAGRLTLADASVAFFRALAAQRRLAVIEDVRALNDRLLAAVRIQLAEGEISTLEGNLAEIELGRAGGRVLTGRRESTSASLELARVLGLGPNVVIRLVADTTAAGGLPPSQHAPQGVIPAAPTVRPDSLRTAAASTPLSEDSLIALALARRPDLAARAAAVEEFQTLTSLARREAIPNLRIGAAAEREPGSNSPGVGLALGLSLPILNRNRGVVAQQQALAEQARLQQRATELRIRTEVVAAVRAYRTATEEAAIFEDMVLGPARQNTALLETAYRAGKIALPTLLLLRNQLLDAELGYWDAWLAQREAIVQLDAATGALTPAEQDYVTTTDSSARTPR